MYYSTTKMSWPWAGRCQRRAEEICYSITSHHTQHTRVALVCLAIIIHSVWLVFLIIGKSQVGVWLVYPSPHPHSGKRGVNMMPGWGVDSKKLPCMVQVSRLSAYFHSRQVIYYNNNTSMHAAFLMCCPWSCDLTINNVCRHCYVWWVLSIWGYI